MDLSEKMKALEVLLRQKIVQSEELMKQRNEVVADMIKVQGKIELLRELMREAVIKDDTVIDEPAQ